MKFFNSYEIVFCSEVYYLLVSKIKSMITYSKDMVKLGKVEDFEIDPDEMKITHLVLELENQVAKEIFDKSPKIRRLKGRVSSQLIETFKDAIILREPIKDLKDSVENL